MKSRPLENLKEEFGWPQLPTALTLDKVWLRPCLSSRVYIQYYSLCIGILSQLNTYMYTCHDKKIWVKLHVQVHCNMWLFMLQSNCYIGYKQGVLMFWWLKHSTNFLFHFMRWENVINTKQILHCIGIYFSRVLSQSTSLRMLPWKDQVITYIINNIIDYFPNLFIV